MLRHQVEDRPDLEGAVPSGRGTWIALGVGEPTTFTYRNRGLAVTLGRNQGTAQVYRFTFTGLPAWLMGRSYHLLMMPTPNRKVRIALDWTVTLLFPRDVVALGSLQRPHEAFARAGQPSPLPRQLLPFGERSVGGRRGRR